MLSTTKRGKVRGYNTILLIVILCFLVFLMATQFDTEIHFIDCNFDVKNYLLYVKSDYKTYKYGMLTEECQDLMNNVSLVKSVMFTDGHVIDQGCNATTIRCPERAHFDKNLNVTIFAPPCCRKHVVEVYHQVIDLFEKYDITYSLYGGSVLGMVRHNGKMIPYDDDIDILADIKDRPAFFTFIVPELTKSGRLVYNVGYQRQYHIYYSAVNFVAADIFWYILKNESFMDTFVSWTLPQFFFPLQTMMFEGRLVKVPINITGYLTSDYGKNWVNTHACSYHYGHNCAD